MHNQRPKGFFFSLPSISVDKTLMPLLEVLALNGYEIIYYNTEAFRPDIPHHFTFKPYPNSYCGYDTKALNGTTTYYEFGEMLLDTTTSLMDFLLTEAQAGQPDFILHSHLAVWGKLLALHLKLPQVTLYTTFVLDEKIVLPHLQKTKKMRDAEHTGSAIHFYRRYQKIFQRMALSTQPSIWDIYVNEGPLNLCCTLEALQPCREVIGPHFHFIGYPFSASIEAHDRTLIYVSMGTIFEGDISFYKSCLRVLTMIPHSSVVVLGKKLDPNELCPVPPHIQMCRFTNQASVLQRSLVFVSRGGMASVMEAVYSLTPLIVVPQIPEQQLSAERIEALGIGMVIRPEDFNDEQFHAALQHVLAHRDQYVKQLQRLRDDIPEEATALLALKHINQYLETYAVCYQ